eukprot:Hpha_TRINITY_DN19767_c0_g1::TRINITY_DN19767_c0_g1_i1::g.21686::m.21686/K08770/UBC; ubiquitin C
MSGGLVLYVRVEPEAVGSGAPESVAVVEVDPGAVVSDVTAQLIATGAAVEGVELEWQGKRLRPSELLADAGVCPQSTLYAFPRRVVKMEIFVHTLQGAMVALDVASDWTVLAVKKAVTEKICGIQPDQMRFVFARQLLNDDETLEHYKVVEGAEIKLACVYRR